MASTAWKRKTYGPVKPVKPVKVPKPVKPSILELKAIFKLIETGTGGLTIDALCQALSWWDRALPYIVSKRPFETLAQGKALIAAGMYTRDGQQAQNSKDKEVLFSAALMEYRKYASTVFSTPPIAPYFKALRLYEKKNKDTYKRMDSRFEKLTTLMGKCFSDCLFEFRVHPHLFAMTLKEEITNKIDHSLNVIYISKNSAIALQREIRESGLFPAMVDEAYRVARAMSFDGVRNGVFIVDTLSHLINYRLMLKSLMDYVANNPEAPKQLVKRKFAKKTKKSEQKILDAIDAGEDVHSVVGHAMTGWKKGKKA